MEVNVRLIRCDPPSSRTSSSFGHDASSRHHVLRRSTMSRRKRQLLESIDLTTPVGLRDRAVIATLFYPAARRGVVAEPRRGDLHADGRQHWFQLEETWSRPPSSRACRSGFPEYPRAPWTWIEPRGRWTPGNP